MCVLVSLAFTRMKSILMALDTKVASVTKKMRQQTLNAQAAEAFRIVLDILHEISETYGKIKNSAIKSHARVKVQINWLLASLPCRGQISKQEIADIKRELKRLHYMVRLLHICVRKYKNNSKILFIHSCSTDGSLSNGIGGWTG